MINLTKGSIINLRKNEVNLEKIYVGVNWGMISRETSSFFGLFSDTKLEKVDLDASVAVFDQNRELIDKIFFNKTKSDDGAIVHSGDDRQGDSASDDADNEVISIDLHKVRSNAEQIVFFINSYNGQAFDSVPYSKIRILDDTLGRKVPFAQFNLSAQPEYKRKTSMVMAKVVREKDGWKFVTIGEAVDTKKVDDTIELIQKMYL